MDVGNPGPTLCDSIGLKGFFPANDLLRIDISDPLSPTRYSTVNPSNGRKNLELRAGNFRTTVWPARDEMQLHLVSGDKQYPSCRQVVL